MAHIKPTLKSILEVVILWFQRNRIPSWNTC